MRDQESESIRTSMILCCETPPPPLGLMAKDSTAKLPKCLEWVDGCLLQMAETYSGILSASWESCETRMFHPFCAGSRKLAVNTGFLTSRKMTLYRLFDSLLNLLHSSTVFVCPFHLSGNYSNYINHLLSVCSRCHWSGPGNGFTDRFKSWSGFFSTLSFPANQTSPPPIHPRSSCYLWSNFSSTMRCSKVPQLKVGGLLSRKGKVQEW